MLSFLGGHDLPLAFRPIELAAITGAALVVALTVANGRSSRRKGVMLLVAYATLVIAFGFVGER